MRIQISPGTTVPIYRQIGDSIRRLVATGELKVGDPLPSVRQLAKDLVINPNTVSKAYAELSRESVIETRQGRGVFVAKRRSVFTKAERMRRLDEALDVAVAQALALDFTAEEISTRLQQRLEQLNTTHS